MLTNNCILLHISTFTYIFLIFYLLPKINFDKKQNRMIRTMFSYWNLFLSLFSAAGFVICFSNLYDIYINGNMYKFMCNEVDVHASQCTIGLFGLAILLFVWSKIFEFGDTIFLALMKKEILFLHWYHHIVTLYFTCYAYFNKLPIGTLYIVMNYFVHAIMYFYFGASIYTKKLNWLRKPITTIQILQMIFGIIFTVALYLIDCSNIYNDKHYYEYCLLMYTSYLILFCKLYYDYYLK
jgi:elongation of very long chain fatty acids protein 6